MSVSYDDADRFVRRFATTIAEKKEYLTELDSAIGDADHGINMDRGMQAVLPKIDALDTNDIGLLFKTVGMTLVSTVGGAGGPLYGTLFLQLGIATGGLTELDARKGRASYLGERSAGHQDPGATSSHLLVKTAAETWSGG